MKNESDDTQKAIVCIVSLLEYIGKQQVASINKLHGLSAAAVGDNEETDKDIEDGGANIIFAVQAPVVQKPINANPQLNRPNPE